MFQYASQNGSLRFSAPTGGASVVVPAGVRYMTVRNASAINSFLFNFDSEGASNYMTVVANRELPWWIPVVPGRTINVQGVGLGGATGEVLWWG